MKKVFYDCDVFCRLSFGGISKQFSELFSNMKKYEPVVGAYNNCNNFNLQEYFQKINYTQDFSKKVIENTYYSKEVALKGDYDIYHSSYFNLEYLANVNKPWVCTIHDMALEQDYGNLQAIREALKDPNMNLDTKSQINGKLIMVKFADAIIAVSLHTKDKIVEYLNCNPDKIHVCYQGINEDFINLEEDLELKKQISKYQYILYIGNRAGYKNFDMLLKEFQKVTKKYKDLILLCTGKPFTDEEKKMFDNLKLTGKIAYCMFKNDAQMKTLYKNAKCFVFPSRYEGFGLPIIEAFASGCPCLLNNMTCFPEIGGDAAIYFSLNDKQNDFMEVFDKFMHMSEDEINEYRKKGLERCKMFTFQKFTEAVENVYDEVLKNN